MSLSVKPPVPTAHPILHATHPGDVSSALHQITVGLLDQAVNLLTRAAPTAHQMPLAAYPGDVSSMLKTVGLDQAVNLLTRADSSSRASAAVPHSHGRVGDGAANAPSAHPILHATPSGDVSSALHQITVGLLDAARNILTRAAPTAHQMPLAAHQILHVTYPGDVSSMLKTVGLDQAVNLLTRADSSSRASAAALSSFPGGGGGGGGASAASAAVPHSHERVGVGDGGGAANAPLTSRPKSPTTGGGGGGGGGGAAADAGRSAPLRPRGDGGGAAAAATKADEQKMAELSCEMEKLKTLEKQFFVLNQTLEQERSYLNIPNDSDCQAILARIFTQDLFQARTVIYQEQKTDIKTITDLNKLRIRANALARCAVEFAQTWGRLNPWYAGLGINYNKTKKQLADFETKTSIFLSRLNKHVDGSYTVINDKMDKDETAYQAALDDDFEYDKNITVYEEHTAPPSAEEQYIQINPLQREPTVMHFKALVNNCLPKDGTITYHDKGMEEASNPNKIRFTITYPTEATAHCGSGTLTAHKTITGVYTYYPKTDWWKFVTPREDLEITSGISLKADINPDDIQLKKIAINRNDRNAPSSYTFSQKAREAVKFFYKQSPVFTWKIS